MRSEDEKNLVGAGLKSVLLSQPAVHSNQCPGHLTALITDTRAGSTRGGTESD